MPSRTRHTERREDALSRGRIVEAAVELLDAAGEAKLTFRALTERLATGPGAIYWHVASRGELLAAATDGVVAAALATPSEGSPQERIRAIALGLFAAIDAHPWLAAQLARPQHHGWQHTPPRIMESIGQQVSALGVPAGGRFTATSALMYYILGAAGQNAANGEYGRALGPDASRSELLAAAATAWEALDPDGYPFTRAVAGELRDHDDREQFLTGVNLILAGITASLPDAR